MVRPTNGPRLLWFPNASQPFERTLIGGANRLMAVSPDGQRFVFLRGGTGQTGEDVGRPQLIIVQNWHEELKRFVPVD